MKSATCSCCVCGGSDIVFCMNKKTYDIMCCKKCQLKFVWPLPYDLPLQNIYSENYFHTAKDGHGYVNYDKDKKAMISTFATYFSLLEHACPQKGTILDVGAATGFFLELARERGWKVAGVEISDYAASLGRNKGLDIRTGRLEEVLFEEQSFDVITLLDVLEHVTHPANLLHAAHRLLTPTGLILISTPDAGSFYARLLGKRWHAIVPPEHLFYFNKTSLDCILHETGFEKAAFFKTNKKFRFSYIMSTAGRWLESQKLQNIAGRIESSFLSRMGVTLPLYDNILLIAQKCH